MKARNYTPNINYADNEFSKDFPNLELFLSYPPKVMVIDEKKGNKGEPGFEIAKCPDWPRRSKLPAFHPSSDFLSDNLLL